MDKNKISNFLGILDSIQQNSEQKAYLENCKNLNELSEFIISKYPKCNLSKEELQKCLLAFGIILKNDGDKSVQHLTDGQLDISGGVYYPGHAAAQASVERFKERSQTLRKGAVMAEMMSQIVEIIDAGGTPNVAEMSDKIVSALSGQELTGNYRSKDMANISGRLNKEITTHLSDVRLKRISHSDKLSRVKKHDTTGRSSEHRFNEFMDID